MSMSCWFTSGDSCPVDGTLNRSDSKTGKNNVMMGYLFMTAWVWSKQEGQGIRLLFQINNVILSEKM
jgi:hypothetical protein